MHTRVLTFRGAKNIDDGIAFVRDEAVPIVSEQKGYRGLTVSADRAGGVVGILSLWDTEANREASLGALADLRERGVKVVGGELTVESFEQLVEELASPPMAGAALMVTRISMDPAKIDENIDYFRRDALPEITARPGFLGLRHMMDRQTGRGVVGSAWAHQDAMQAWAADAPTRRQNAQARGVNFGEVSYREILFAHIP